MQYNFCVVLELEWCMGHQGHSAERERKGERVGNRVDWWLCVVCVVREPPEWQ